MSNDQGIYRTSYQLYQAEASRNVQGGVIDEALVCIFVNGQKLATFMCTPRELDELAPERVVPPMSPGAASHNSPPQTNGKNRLPVRSLQKKVPNDQP